MSIEVHPSEAAIRMEWAMGRLVEPERGAASAVEEPETLLGRVARGEQRAVELFVERYGGLIWSLARRLTPRGADPEDAVQEIFIDMWKSAHRFDARRSSETTFVAMVARRRLIDRLRRSAQRPELRPIEDASHVAGDDGAAVERSLEASIAARVLESLRPEQRRCIELAVHEGMSHGEIADATHIPLGTVKSHIRRGLAAIRERLEAGASAAAFADRVA